MSDQDEPTKGDLEVASAALLSEEEIFYRARLKIVELSQTEGVQKFLSACALNVISMERDGDAPVMEFTLHGRTFTFSG